MPEYGVPESTLRKLASSARRSERAIVVGNRDGFIEWANDAWTRVTGYALHESVSKPIHGFLEGVDIDPAAVDFVGRCFQEGRVCELELALTPPGRRELWIELRVEPLVDARGEVSDFIATATDVTERKRAEAGAGLAEVDLSQLAARVAEGQRHRLGERGALDFDLDPGLPLVLSDPRKLESLVARRIAHGIESLGEAWGTITLWTGILGGSRGPIYGQDPARGLPPGQWVFLEVHDSGGHPDGVHHTAVTEPFLSTTNASDPLRYAEAEAWLREQGGELRMESSPIEGTSVVMLFPYASDDSGWFDSLEP
jgi:PAS domain S-box-containing protein